MQESVHLITKEHPVYVPAQVLLVQARSTVASEKTCAAKFTSCQTWDEKLFECNLNGSPVGCSVLFFAAGVTPQQVAAKIDRWQPSLQRDGKPWQLPAARDSEGSRHGSIVMVFFD